MVYHASVMVVYINFGVGSIEDAVRQLDVVDNRHDGSVAVWVIHIGSVGVSMMVVHVVVPVLIHFKPSGVMVVMVLHVVTHIHHQTGTGVGEGGRPNRSFMILQE